MVDPALSHRKKLCPGFKYQFLGSGDASDSGQQVDIFHTRFFGKKGGCKKLDIKNTDFFLLHVLAENRAEIDTAAGQRVQMCCWPPSRCCFQFGIVLFLQQPNGTLQRHSIARVK